MPRANFAPHRRHKQYPDLAVEIGRRIREGRERLGWTQGGFARRVGKSQGAVEQWETGLTMPRAEILVALSRVLGFNLDDLASDAPPIDTSDAADRGEGGGTLINQAVGRQLPPSSESRQ